MGEAFVPAFRRRCREGNGSSNKQQGHGAESNPATALLKEAEMLQNQGERKDGEKKRRCLQMAVTKFRAVLNADPSAEQRCDALMGLGDCLLKAAHETVESAPGASTWEEEASLAATAANLCEQSAHAYEQVLGDDGATREDARVNMGNALALWAEHCETRGDNPLAMGLLERAAACYDSALAKTPEDVDICTNLADVTMQRAELAHTMGRVQSSEQLYQQGIELYMRGCSFADSRVGDDLPGLVFNWGVGLYSMAQHVKAPEAALSHLVSSAAKLKESMALAVTDPRVFNALGDTFAAQGEEYIKLGQRQEALAAFDRALGSDGYGGALRISSRDVDATIGLAETHLSIARLMVAQEEAVASDGPVALAGSVARFAQSAELYACAFRLLSREGPRWKFNDRCEVRLSPPQSAFFVVSKVPYSEAGQCEAAFQILSGLVQCGAVGVGELLSDADLVRVRDQHWFQDLVSKCTVP